MRIQKTYDLPLLVLLFSIVLALQVFAQEDYNLSPGKKIIITDATFKQGSAVIEDSQRSAFARLAEFLKKRERLNIEIGGHADNIGSEQQNVALSLGRAEAVREFLVMSGIASSRIRTRGYGSQLPIASNNDESGRTKNRRVEIIGLSAFSGKLLASPDGKALPPEARITMLKPPVRVMPAWEGDWQEAVIDQPLYEAFKVSTLEGARADITFRNNSVLHVSDDALLMIYGFDSAPTLGGGTSSTKGADAIAKNIELTKGNLSLKLREMRAQDTFSIRTNVSEVGFNTSSQNASAKVRVDARERSIISVLEGRANVKVTANDPRTGQTLEVGEEYGIIVGDSSEDSRTPKRLPTMPELLEPAERITPTESGVVSFRWSNGGLTARLEIAANIEFTELVYNQIRKTQSADVNLPEGTYFIRLTSIDSIGFESRSRLRGLVISREVPDKSASKPFRFRYVEFGLLVLAGGCFWAGLLFNKNILKQIAAGLVAVSLVMFLLL
ncbi:MAG: OmpA family protein [Candidatus Kapabacteria bacterium]|nr:OmpA family protein [Candidatus Kapabacteria bacterium]